MADPNLFQTQLLLSATAGLALFLAVLALAAWVRHYRIAQEAFRRSLQAGADEAYLQAVQQRGNFLTQLAALYDQSDAAQKVRVQLARANFHIKPSQYLALRILLGLLLFYISLAFVHLNFFLAFGIALLAAVYLPPFYLRTQRRRYLHAFDAQLIEATATMASAIRAGLSVPQAIEQVSRKLPAPAGDEFRQLSREVNLLGVSLETSLANALRRLPSEDLSVVVVTLLIQRQAGGNLVKALSQLSHIMRERAQVRNEIRTMTAEVRFTTLIVIFLPVLTVIFLRNLAPELVQPLFTHPIGWVVLVLFASVQFVGYIIVRRIANIRV